MTDVEERVWRSIQDAGPGRGNTVTVDRLRWMTEIEPRHIRQVVRNLVLEHGKPIATSYKTDVYDAGYFIPETPDEIIASCKSLRGHALCILQRMAALNRQSLPALLGQMRLECLIEMAGR